MSQEGAYVPVRPDRIREARKRLDLTQRQFGQLFGVSPRSVGMWENGTREPRPARQQAIADAVHVDIAWLVSPKQNHERMAELLAELQALIAEGFPGPKS